jgi:hypothetical protein
MSTPSVKFATVDSTTLANPIVLSSYAPAGGNVDLVQVQVNGGDVRYSLDGSLSSTATVGMLLKDGDDVILPTCRVPLSKMQFVANSGSTPALSIHFLSN